MQGAPTNKIMYLWAVFVESVLGYGAFLFSFDELPSNLKQKFYTLYYKSIKYSLSLAKNTSNIKLCVAANVMTPQQLADLKFVCVADRLLKCREENLN